MRKEKKIDLDRLSELYKSSKKELLVVGVGTDKVIYDSFGPMTTTLLKERIQDVSVCGTLSNLCHALNIKDKLEEIDLDKYFVLAIDSAVNLDDPDNFKNINIYTGQCKPGLGLGKKLINFGDACITFDVGQANCVFEELGKKVSLGDIYFAANEAATIIESIIKS